MKIRLLHTNQCHAWKQAEINIHQALKNLRLSGLPVEITEVATPEDAEKLRFFGSPSIQINSVDIDPMTRNLRTYSLSSCRPYIYQGKTYDYPPVEMIQEALASQQTTPP